MSYATQSDMIMEFGEREVMALTDRDNVGAIDTALLQRTLDNATEEINAYLVGRYVVPLLVVSKLLVTYCCDIARYRLSGAQVTEVDVVRNRYKDALRFLEAVRDGKIDLGAGVAATTDEATQNLVYFTGGSRMFSRENR